MLPVIRVNIHPRPADSNWDVSIPYHGNSYNQSSHVADSYLSQWLALVPTDRRIMLVCNGAPISRQIAVRSILHDRYPQILIEHPKSLHRDELIFQEPWIAVNRHSGFDDRGLLNFYREIWPQLEFFSERYQYCTHSRDHGYFANVKRRWYQWGQDMPSAPSKLHQEIYQRFDALFEATCDMLSETLTPLNLDRKKIRSGLMFRLNHNPPGSNYQGRLVNRHGDNSIVTVWMSQSHPGAMIDRGQAQAQDPCPIEQIIDTDRQLLIFPGFDYCDVSGSGVPATWHSVDDTEHDEDRVALVAFLKYL